MRRPSSPVPAPPTPTPSYSPGLLQAGLVDPGDQMAGRGEKSRCRWSWGGQLRPGSALPALLMLEDG